MSGISQSGVSRGTGTEYARDAAGNIIGLVGENGAIPIGNGVNIVNLKGLRRWGAAKGRAWYSPAQINCFGDSVTLGSYSNDTSIPVDSVADLQAWPGVLRSMFAAEFGLGTATGGGFIAANDERVTLVSPGTVTQTVGLPIQTVRVDNTTVNGSVPALGAGATQSYAVPACTSIEILYLDSSSSSVQGGIGINTGTFKASVDGGADLFTTTADNAYAINYKRVSTGLTALANTTHTLLVSNVTGTCYIIGILYKQATGVQVNRFGQGGATALDLTGDGYQTHFATGGPNRLRGFAAASAAPVTINANITSGSAVATMASSTAALKRGMPIGANAQIPASCWIASVDSDTQITMSSAATGSNAARPLFIGAGTTLGGDLWIIPIGHNDWQQQNDATYNSTALGMYNQLQTMINAITDAGGCVLLVGTAKSNTSSPSPEGDAIEAYWAKLTALAVANDHCAAMHVNQSWGTFAQGVALGFQSSTSGVHPLRLGAANFAGLVYKVLSYAASQGSAAGA